MNDFVPTITLYGSPGMIFLKLFSFKFHFSNYVIFSFLHLFGTVASLLKHPRTPPTNNPRMDYQIADSKHVSKKRSRPLGTPDKVSLSKCLCTAVF